MLVSLILFYFASTFNAIMDNLKDHFYKSVFNVERLNKRFWNYAESNKKPIYIPFTKYKWDAWHISKTISGFLIIGSVLTLNHIPVNLMEFVIMFIVYLSTWILNFNLFYNVLLNKHD